MCAKKKSCMHKLLKMHFPMKTNLPYMYQKINQMMVLSAILSGINIPSYWVKKAYKMDY